MSSFDAVRNRKRGEEAKQRVLSRTYSPKEEEQQESAFSSVRNRKIEDKSAVDSAITKGILKGTLSSVGVGAQKKQTTQEPVDFKADQAKKKQTEVFQGKLPAPSLLNIPTAPLQTQLQGRLPVASALNQTGGGPSDASHNFLSTEYDIRDKAIDETNIPEALKYPSRAMNTLAFGNPVGRFISNSFSGNSGVTQRDSTGSAAADKVSDVINQFVTPFITPTGAPVGTGPNMGAYDITGKALASKPGQAVVNTLAKGIGKVAPRASRETAQEIARLGATETLAGPIQSVATGLVNQQDSNEEIGRNALYGLAGGAALGFGTAVLGKGARALLSRYVKSKGGAEAGVTAPESTVSTVPEPALSSPDTVASTPEITTPSSVQGPTRARLATKPGLNAILEQMKPLVDEHMTPPLENQNELAKWIQRNFSNIGDNISLNEIRSLGYEDMRQLSDEIRKQITVEEAARQVAKDLGYDFDKLLTERTIPRDLVQRARQTQELREAYGVGNPVRSSAEVGVQPRDAGALPAREVPADPAVFPEPVEAPMSARDQEIANKPVSELTQEDIDYLLESSKQPEPETIRSSPEPVPKEVPEPQPVKATVKTEVQEAEEAVQAVNHPNVRDKVYSYLDEAEAAARARLAKRKGNLNSNPAPEWADYAVIMAAKLGKGTIKAANFTEELVKEFGEKVRPHAERILRMSREELRRQERIASDEGKAAVEFNAKEEGDIQSFTEKISREAKVRKKPFAEQWQKWRTQTSDDLEAVETLEKNVRGGKLASAEDSLYKAARLYRGAPERASQIVQDRLGSVIKKVEDAGGSIEDLENYALAMHSRDVNAAGYKSGFTNQEIKAVLDQFGSEEMQAAQQELVKVNRDMLKELVDSGVVSQELYDVLGERWKNYIPLFREMDSDKVGFEGGISKALANVTSPIKSLQGSERKVIAPLENMVKNIFQSVNAAERNKVAQQIPKLAELDPESKFIRQLNDAEDIGQKNVVKVKVGGKDLRYEVQPEVYKALMNLDQESSNTLINILSKPASVLRSGATLTPEFALRNPIRDINNAFVVSESGFNPITDFGAGLIQTIKKGPLYKEWIDNLGAYGNTLSMDRNVHKKALETVLKQPPSKKFVNVITGKSMIRLLRAISDTTESATKVGEYRAALRSGASKQEAAYRSRDLMDFARAGSSVRPANRIVSFLNANIQGKSKLVRAIKNDPWGVVARGFSSVTVPTGAIFLANHQFANDTQKETINNAPDWMKDSFWLLAVPGTDVVARIPKPFDLAAVFSNLPEKALQFVFDKDPQAFDGYVRRTLKDSSLPSQISGLLPLIEGMANYSFFKEGPIIPRAEQGLQYKDQYDPVRTTTPARIIAGGVEKLTGGKGAFKNFSSPRIVDNTIQGLTAGLGKYATDVVDVILDKTGAYERTTKPAKSIEQAPFTRSFLVDPNQGGKAMDKFYQMKDELTKEKASAKLNKTTFKKIGTLTRLNNASDRVSDLNKRIKAVERGNLSSKEKQARIKTLTETKNRIVQETMKAINKQK